MAKGWGGGWVLGSYNASYQVAMRLKGLAAPGIFDFVMVNGQRLKGQSYNHYCPSYFVRYAFLVAATMSDLKSTICSNNRAQSSNLLGHRRHRHGVRGGRGEG